MNRRNLLVLPMVSLLGIGATSEPSCDVVTLRMPVRMAMGLRRALMTGSPMAGPEVAPLIGRLSDALGVEESGPAEYGPPAPMTTY